MIKVVADGTGSASAQCPPDHPYAIGGGSGDTLHSIGGGMLSSEPIFSTSTNEPIAWTVAGIVNLTCGDVQVIVLISKARQLSSSCLPHR